MPSTPVADYLEYIEEGEGSWALTTEGLHGGKKTYSSSDNIDTVTISVPEERALPDGRQGEFDETVEVPAKQVSDASMIVEIMDQIE